MTFDEWVDINQKFIDSFQCVGEYGGDVYELMENAWNAGKQEGYDEGCYQATNSTGC